ncbi:hypothetical protein BACPEC_00975 [[Bacteroides] pectinophilus ATCC 43243]|uniref:Uncharacterized protein n=1 Tax=[Bacteroides] pectinophilus ATCC 43243 TaxID=483218 RepID=B7AQL8_9FIRM|nr:hypothetical protein BACPEC_00975 [[Bacteroides] pectinophilus ATCC 43243]
MWASFIQVIVAAAVTQFTYEHIIRIKKDFLRIQIKMYTQKVLFNIGCADPGLPKDYVQRLCP